MRRIIALGSLTLLLGAIGFFFLPFTHVQAALSPDTADLKCPKANGDTTVYDSSKPKKFTKKVGNNTVQVTNYYGDVCTDPRGVAGICVSNEKPCQAKTYKDINGKEKDVTGAAGGTPAGGAGATPPAGSTGAPTGTGTGTGTGAGTGSGSGTGGSGTGSGSNPLDSSLLSGTPSADQKAPLTSPDVQASFDQAVKDASTNTRVAEEQNALVPATSPATSNPDTPTTPTQTVSGAGLQEIGPGTNSIAPNQTDSAGTALTPQQLTNNASTFGAGELQTAPQEQPWYSRAWSAVSSAAQTAYSAVADYFSPTQASPTETTAPVQPDVPPPQTAAPAPSPDGATQAVPPTDQTPSPVDAATKEAIAMKDEVKGAQEEVARAYTDADTARQAQVDAQQKAQGAIDALNAYKAANPGDTSSDQYKSLLQNAQSAVNDFKAADATYKENLQNFTELRDAYQENYVNDPQNAALAKLGGAIDANNVAIAAANERINTLTQQMNDNPPIGDVPPAEMALINKEANAIKALEAQNQTYMNDAAYITNSANAHAAEVAAAIAANPTTPEGILAQRAAMYDASQVVQAQGRDVTSVMPYQAFGDGAMPYTDEQVAAMQAASQTARDEAIAAAERSINGWTSGQYSPTQQAAVDRVNGNAPYAISDAIDSALHAPCAALCQYMEPGGVGQFLLNLPASINDMGERAFGNPSVNDLISQSSLPDNVNLGNRILDVAGTALNIAPFAGSVLRAGGEILAEGAGIVGRDVSQSVFNDMYQSALRDVGLAEVTTPGFAGPVADAAAGARVIDLAETSPGVWRDMYVAETPAGASTASTAVVPFEGTVVTAADTARAIESVTQYEAAIAAAETPVSAARVSAAEASAIEQANSNAITAGLTPPSYVSADTVASVRAGLEANTTSVLNDAGLSVRASDGAIVRTSTGDVVAIPEANAVGTSQFNILTDPIAGEGRAAGTTATDTGRNLGPDAGAAPVVNPEPPLNPSSGGGATAMPGSSTRTPLAETGPVGTETLLMERPTAFSDPLRTLTTAPVESLPVAQMSALEMATVTPAQAQAIDTLNAALAAQSRPLAAGATAAEIANNATVQSQYVNNAWAALSASGITVTATGALVDSSGTIVAAPAPIQIPGQEPYVVLATPAPEVPTTSPVASAQPGTSPAPSGGAPVSAPAGGVPSSVGAPATQSPSGSAGEAPEMPSMGGGGGGGSGGGQPSQTQTPTQTALAQKPSLLSRIANIFSSPATVANTTLASLTPLGTTITKEQSQAIDTLNATLAAQSKSLPSTATPTQIANAAKVNAQYVGNAMDAITKAGLVVVPDGTIINPDTGDVVAVQTVLKIPGQSPYVVTASIDSASPKVTTSKSSLMPSASVAKPNTPPNDTVNIPVARAAATNPIATQSTSRASGSSPAARLAQALGVAAALLTLPSELINTAMQDVGQAIADAIVSPAEARGRGVSNNNFGNMMNPRTHTPIHFATPEAGAQADLGNMIRWIQRGDNTIAKLITRLSPPHENNTAHMISNISQVTGIGANTILDPANETQMVRIFNQKTFLEHSVHASDVMQAKDITQAYRNAALARGVTPTGGIPTTDVAEGQDTPVSPKTAPVAAPAQTAQTTQPAQPQQVTLNFSEIMNPSTTGSSLPLTGAPINQKIVDQFKSPGLILKPVAPPQLAQKPVVVPDVPVATIPVQTPPAVVPPKTRGIEIAPAKTPIDAQTTVSPTAPVVQTTPEMNALSNQISQIQKRADDVAKKITTIQSNVSTIGGVQNNINSLARQAEANKENITVALTYTSSAIAQGSGLITAAKSIASATGNHSLMNQASALASERGSVASQVSGALGTYKQTQSMFSLMPYMGLKTSVPALLEHASALTAQARSVGQAAIGPLQSQRQELLSTVATAKQELKDLAVKLPAPAVPTVPTPAPTPAPTQVSVQAPVPKQTPVTSPAPTPVVPASTNVPLPVPRPASAATQADTSTLKPTVVKTLSITAPKAAPGSVAPTTPVNDGVIEDAVVPIVETPVELPPAENLPAITNIQITAPQWIQDIGQKISDLFSSLGSQTPAKNITVVDQPVAIRPDQQTTSDVTVHSSDTNNSLVVETPQYPTIQSSVAPTAIVQSIIEGDFTVVSPTALLSYTSPLQLGYAPHNPSRLPVSQEPRAVAVIPNTRNGVTAPVSSIPSEGTSLALRQSSTDVTEHVYYGEILPPDRVLATEHSPLSAESPIIEGTLVPRTLLSSTVGSLAVVSTGAFATQVGKTTAIVPVIQGGVTVTQSGSIDAGAGLPVVSHQQLSTIVSPQTVTGNIIDGDFSVVVPPAQVAHSSPLQLAYSPTAGTTVSVVTTSPPLATISGTVPPAIPPVSSTTVLPGGTVPPVVPPNTPTPPVVPPPPTPPVSDASSGSTPPPTSGTHTTPITAAPGKGPAATSTSIQPLPDKVTVTKNPPKAPAKTTPKAPPKGPGGGGGPSGPGTNQGGGIGGAVTQALGDMMKFLAGLLKGLGGGSPSSPSTPPVTPTNPVTPTATSTASTTIIAILIADPITVASGTPSRLVWSSVNASTCYLTYPNGYSLASTTEGSTSTLPLATTTLFKLGCFGAQNASSTATTTVKVTQF